MQTTPASSNQTQDTRVRSTGARRVLKWVAILLGLFIVLAVGLALTVVQTEWGARQAWEAAKRFAPGQLSGDYVDGTLSDGISLRNIVYQDETKRIELDRIEGTWRLSTSPLKLIIPSLRFGTADVTLQPSKKEDEPTKLPQEIRLPLAFDLQNATLEKVVVHQEDSTTQYSDIRLQASSDEVQHNFKLHNAVTPYGTAQAALQVNGTQPFDVQGTASLKGSYLEQPYTVNGELSGSLQNLGIRLNADGKEFTGQAVIDATPFASLPFRQIKIDIDGLNPSVFNSNWPQADLDIHASLSPVGTPGDMSELTVTGPVSLLNSLPGPIDEDRIPLKSMQSNVTLDAKKQQLSDVQIQMPDNGSLKGGGAISEGGKGEFSLEARQLNLRSLHTALQKTALNGPLVMSFAGDTQRIKLKLADQKMVAIADAEITPQVITLHAAHLEAGRAQLDVTGTLGREGQSEYTVKGALKDFDPALFLSTMQPARGGKNSTLNNLNARINMEFQAQGAMQPELSTKLKFDIHDSRYANLPMSGGGDLHIAGKQILPSNVQLAIAGNEAIIKGSFGKPSDQLKFDINAPALGRLGFGLSGLLQAQGEVGGTTSRPRINATYRAENLRFGEHRLAFLSGEAKINGVPGSTPDARMSVRLRARELQTGEIRLDTANANVDGTYASHTIQADAEGRLRGEPLNLKLSAQGKLSEKPQGMAWDGMINTLENRGVPRLSLNDPLPVSVAPGQLELGAAQISFAQASINLTHLHYTNSLIRSEGAISDLNVGHLLALRRQFTGEEAPVNTSLVLDGRWNVNIADKADGFVQIERRSGDISIASPIGDSRIGLNALSVRADLQGKVVALSTKANATRIGDIEGQGTIGLQPASGHITLTADSPVAGLVTASIPRLQNIASLAGPRIALNGEVTMRLTVDGTLTDPAVSGMLTGQQLALTLFDQGVRLSDGIARIRLNNNVAEIQKLEFRGGNGTLRATGRIPLDQSNPDLTATVVADNLQLLTSPSGQLTVSGQARVGNLNDELAIAGKFLVDRALFSLPEKSPPKLGDDVMVIRGDKPVNAPRSADAEDADEPSSPFSPRINVEIDLGDNFRFEGSGADLRLAGSLTVESAPGESPQAFGTVRVAEGTYEAFGTELNIERGVLNFQGPLTNPNLNIVAMRRQQEVEAGVRITGTVQQPRVQLISEPNVSDEEKLSWLVFGRGGGGTESGQAQSAARGAALGLLNKFGANRIAQGVGLDEFSIGSSDFGMENQQVVNLGKEITDRLSIGYEQSLAGAESVLRLTYQLSRSWTVVARGGAVTGLNLFYNKRFDGLGGIKRSRRDRAE